MKVVSGKVSIVMRILVFAFSPASALAGPVVFHEEGFESGFPTGSSALGSWAVVNSSASAHDGSAGADIDGPTGPGGDTLTLPISSAGYHSLVASIWAQVRSGFEGDDQVLVEWTSDGGDRATLQVISNRAAGGWELYSFNLPPSADDNADLALIFTAQLSSTGDRMNFDSLTLTGIPIPEPTPLSLLSLGALTLVRRRFV